VSSIWTPSGEYRPEPEPSEPTGTPTGYAGGGEPSADEIEAVRQIQAQIRATPAAAIVANHVIQLFELAVVYLGVATPPDELGRVPMPDLAQAGVAIDAMSALIDGLGARYGEDEQTLRDALAQIQMLYVQVADALSEATGTGSEG
jgi:hypothetical protein